MTRSSTKDIKAMLSILLVFMLLFNSAVFVFAADTEKPDVLRYSVEGDNILLLDFSEEIATADGVNLVSAIEFATDDTEELASSDTIIAASIEGSELAITSSGSFSSGNIISIPAGSVEDSSGNANEEITFKISTSSDTSPKMVSATLDFSTRKLAVTCTNLVTTDDTKLSKKSTDINSLMFTLKSNGTSFDFTKNTPNVKITSATKFELVIGEKDMPYVSKLFAEGSEVMLVADPNWDGSTSKGDKLGVSVEPTKVPSISGASLDVAGGKLVVTGENFIDGSKQDIYPQYITISNGNDKAYTLTKKEKLSYTSTTQFTVTIDTKKDLPGILGVVDRNGELSRADTPYNIEVAAGWNGTSSFGDLYGNPVVVEGYAKPTKPTLATTDVITGKTVNATVKNLGYAYVIAATQYPFTSAEVEALYTAGKAGKIQIKKLKDGSATVKIPTKNNSKTALATGEYKVIVVDMAGCLSQTTDVNIKAKS